jgi:hypothetical protein
MKTEKPQLVRCAASFGLSIVALFIAPAQSQPIGGGGPAGLFSPAPMTGSSPEQPYLHPGRTVPAPSSNANSPEEAQQNAAPSLPETIAPTASTAPPLPGPLWTRREIAPAATRTTPKPPPRNPRSRTASAPPPVREAVKQASIQKRHVTQRSQVRPNRLGTKPSLGRQEVQSRRQASTRAATQRQATRQARRTAPATIQLAPRGEPQLPLGLMPRHARRGE